MDIPDRDDPLLTNNPVPKKYVPRFLRAPDFHSRETLPRNGLEKSHEDTGPKLEDAGELGSTGIGPSFAKNVLQHEEHVYQDISIMNCHRAITKTINFNFDDLDSVSRLQNTRRFSDIIQKVEEALQKGLDGMEGNPEYNLISDCADLGISVEDEIAILHYFVCEKYCVKFPELASLVLNPIYYARSVKQIGNEMDLTLVDLEGLLPPAIASSVSLAASTTRGKPLLEENLKKTVGACDRLLSLDLAKKMILEFLEGRMEYFAPNLS